MFEDALAGKLKLLWIVGQNPAVTVPNLKLTFDAMAKLETLVVQEIWETETAAFWRRPGVDPKSISTEVILLPAAFFMEKNGTISNSGGMVQWRHAAVKPPGQARPDGEIVDLVFRAVRDLVKDSKEPRTKSSGRPSGLTPRPRTSCARSTGTPCATTRRPASRRAISSARSAIFGRTVRPAHGSTPAFSLTARTSRSVAIRKPTGGLGLYPGFGWTWPNNLRILYNRASCDRHGKPYPGSKPIVWWDEQAKRWTGYDVPDVPVLTDGPATPNGQRAFHLGAEGVGRLFAAVYSDPDEESGVSARRGLRAEGRPAAGDVRARRESGGERAAPEGEPQPAAQVSADQVLPADRYGPPVPYVLMTSTVAEHWCGGSSTRNIPWLNELVPSPCSKCQEALRKSCH